MFGRKKEEPVPEKSTIDKIVMGAIIGTAIGSVIGLTMAPKKGQETRKMITDNLGELKNVPKLTQETTRGVWNLIKNLVFKRNKKQAPDRKHVPQALKEIPNEMEVPEAKE